MADSNRYRITNSVYLWDDHAALYTGPYEDLWHSMGNVVLESPPSRLVERFRPSSPVGAPPDWMRDALCTEPAYAAVDFFGRTWNQAKEAIAVCGRCIVKAECLADARESENDGVTCGVRGGLTARQRELKHEAEIAERPAVPSFVYFGRKDDLIKIGWSIHPDERIKTLHCELLLAVPGSRDLEQKLHKMFSGLRVTGEWFRADAGLLRFIEVLQREQVAA